MQDFKEDSNIYKLPELTSEIKKMTRQNSSESLQFHAWCLRPMTVNLNLVMN